MRAHLLYRDRDFDLAGELPRNEEELTRDLELEVLFESMAMGDGFLYEVARRTLLSSLDDPEEIRYRQDILADCLARPEVVREI